jgi:hypothetical protein
MDKQTKSIIFVRYMGPGVCKVRGSYLPLQPCGSTAWPYSRTSRVAEAAGEPQGATSCPSGPRAALPRGPRPTAMWRGERAGRGPRLNSHQCTAPQLSLTAFNAVRADMRCRLTNPRQSDVTSLCPHVASVSVGVEVGMSHPIGASFGVPSMGGGPPRVFIHL